MNIILWILQALLSVTLLWSTYVKLFYSPDQLAAMWPWTADNFMLTKITAMFDLLAAIGLLVPKTTVYAAYGLIALMLSAIIFHVSRGEASQVGFNVFVIAVAGFIAWKRR